MKSNANLCEGNLFSRILLYTIPIILTGVLQLLFNAADLVVVGRCCGSLSVAAVGATGSIINLITNLFIGLSVGAGVTVAHAFGAHMDEDAAKTVHTAIPLACICGIMLTIIGVAGARTYLIWMDTPSDILDLSAVYMRIYFCGITASMVYNFGSAILRAAGDTQSPLLYLTIAGVLNVILNLFFVMVFHMDVDGVALATAISQTLSAILVLFALHKRSDACRLTWKGIRFHRNQLLKIVRIGLPAGIQGSLFAISNVMIQSSVNSFGSVVVSGNSAAQNLEGFTYTTMNSFHQTALNFTGQNFGAGKFDRIRRILGFSLLYVFAFGLLAGSATYFFGSPLLRIYIPDSEAAVQYGLTRLAYISLPYFLCGLMDVMTGMIRGMGSSVAPMLICVIGVCGMRIAWISTVFRLSKYHSPKCLYLSYPISWLITFFAQLLVFIYIYYRRKKEMEQIQV